MIPEIEMKISSIDDSVKSYPLSGDAARFDDAFGASGEAGSPKSSACATSSAAVGDDSPDDAAVTLSGLSFGTDDIVWC